MEEEGRQEEEVGVTSQESGGGGKVEKSSKMTSLTDSCKSYGAWHSRSLNQTRLGQSPSTHRRLSTIYL